MTQVVMTNSFRGGTGKSTIISNLASYLASLGRKTIIIDADVISPGVHAIFGLDETTMDKTLTDYINGDADILDAVYDVSDNMNLLQNTLLIVPGSMSRGNIAELVQNKKSSEKLVKAIGLLKEEFKPDFILVDTHPGLNDEFLVVSSVTDTILNIVRPDNQDYQGLKVTSQVTQKLKLNSWVILNKVHQKLRNDKLKKQVAGAYKIPVAGMLPNSDDIMLAQSQYVYSERYPDSEFSKEIYAIAENVFGVKALSHLDIMHEILEDVSKGKGLDKCMADMPKAKCKLYFDGLENEGFTKKGKITEKGEKFLRKYKSIKKFVKGFRL